MTTRTPTPVAVAVQTRMFHSELVPAGAVVLHRRAWCPVCGRLSGSWHPTLTAALADCQMHDRTLCPNVMLTPDPMPAA